MTQRELLIQRHVMSLECFINNVITEEAFLREQREWEEMALWNVPK